MTGGALYVNGTQTGAGPATVGNGATLGGSGRLGGNVTVQSGGTLAPGGVGAVPGTLTVGGDLTLQGGSTLAYSFGQAGVVGGPFNDLTNVGGNLALGGTLNVQTSAGGSFDPGVYRVINYAGTRSGTLALGTVPSPGNYFIQTSVDKQVNLVNTNGLTLNYWDGAIGPKNDGQVNGGSGVWTANGALTNDNWTGMDGALNAPWTQSAFAVFMGQSGIVSVDSIINGPLLTQGMQFAANGYTLVNNTALDALTLVGVPVSGGPNEAVIRVGDGTAGGTGYTATIAATLAGAAKLVKTDLGTLVLSGINTYTGGTAVNGGTLQVSQDSNMGALAGALSLNGGTLATTATFDTARATTLGASGQLQCRGGHQLRHHQRRRRQRRIEQAGQRHADPGCGQHLCRRHDDFRRDAAAGFRRGGSATGGILGNVANNGTLVFNRSNSYTFSGLVSGTGGVTQLGSGTTILTADNTYTGGTTISAGTLQLGAGGATGGIVGNVVNNGGLVFNRGNGYAFGGVISGTGSVTQQGAGTTVLSGNNYTGATTVSAGGLYVNGDQTAATGATTVNNATLGGKGVIGGDVTLTGNTLSPGDNSPAPGTLTIKGNLALGSGTALNYSSTARPLWRPAGVNDNWTDAAGSVNAPWSQGAFAVFTGQSGTVRVDSTTNGPINVQGMQFATDGYVLQGNAAGDKLTLTGTPTGGGGPNEAVIRVGAGSADGAGYTATISAVLDGAASWSRPTWARWCCRGSIPTPAARPSTAARCRSRRTATWAPWRARCRSTAARWPRPRRSTRRAPPRWARAAAASTSRRAPTSASPALSAAAAH